MAGRNFETVFHLVIAPLMVACALLALQIAPKTIRAPMTDEYCYLGIAADLIEHGVFSNGCFREPGGGIASGRFFAPAYPLFLAGAAALDPTLRTTIVCHGRNEATGGKGCPDGFGSLIAIQGGLAALSALLIFLVAREAGGSSVVAWLTMLLALASGELATYARAYLTETLAFLAFFAFLLGLVRGIARGSGAALALAGAALGLAILTRPSYLLLLPVTTCGLLLLPVLRRGPAWPKALLWSGAFALLGLLVILPWSLRNAGLFGDPALTQGYGGFIFAQRLSYDRMSAAEWAVAFIYWLPDFGDRLAAGLFRPELYARLGFNDHQTFYKLGVEDGRRALAQGQDIAELAVLTAGAWAKHAAVTLPLMLRGLWAGKYLGLIGLAATGPALVLMWRAGRLPLYLAMLLPPLVMAGVHAFVSVNVVRYNVPMIAPFAFAITVSAIAVSRRFRPHGARAPD